MTAGNADAAAHWDGRYAAGVESVSWFQADPAASLELIGEYADPSCSVVDVGGGASRLVDALLGLGYRDLTVVDVSPAALRASHDRVGNAPVAWVATDIRDWQPTRAFDVWHDRAAYHFLAEIDDQQAYWQLVRDSVAPAPSMDAGCPVTMASAALSASDGPQTCSGLPVVRYSAADLAESMGEGFSAVASRVEEHLTPAGAAQSFQWVVAERVAPST